LITWRSLRAIFRFKIQTNDNFIIKCNLDSPHDHINEFMYEILALHYKTTQSNKYDITVNIYHKSLDIHKELLENVQVFLTRARSNQLITNSKMEK
jgi:hypothetical protein